MYLFLLVLSILSACTRSGFFEPEDSTSSYESVTGNASDADRSRWEQIYSTAKYVYGKNPAEILIRAESFFPKKRKRALDLAMGEGRNAVFLAKKGFDVLGVDFSTVAIRKALQLAREKGVRIQTQNADLRDYEIPEKHYDLIVNIDFLERSLIEQIKNGLKPKGILVFQTYNVDQLKNEKGPKIAKEYLLRLGELKQSFSEFEFLFYEESNDGVNSLSSLIARKPAIP